MKKYILISLGVILIASAGFYLNSHSSGLDIQGVAHSTGAGTEGAKNLGPAPEFAGISTWLNSDPLTIESLRGKVVLVDFWTYSCINCIRTLPYVTKWYDTYKDQGLVVVGIHTPEFGFEKETSNVKNAISRFKINYPVGQDNDYATWSAYSNQYWPAEYLIDKNGNIVYTHFGEGNYDITENTIRSLLGLETETMHVSSGGLDKVGSPEMYFEPQRIDNLTASQKIATSDHLYTAPSSLALNTFALDGTWKFVSDGAVLTKPNGTIKLKFHSGKAYIVAKSPEAVSVGVTVDGKAQPSVQIGRSDLYTVYDSQDYTDHTIELTIPSAGFEAFTFTFG
jgi:thiol-disulfide isomerase/thioredoxin